jgi:hypothetical protein
MDNVIKINFESLKPPWIHKADFYKMPFNYCDHWCEKCVLTSICRVYKNNQKAKKKCKSKGIDPYSSECAIESAKDSLDEAMGMIVKEFEKMKLDSNDLPEDEVIFESQTFPLYELSKKICQKIDEFLDSLIDFVGKEGDSADVLGNLLDYYKHLIPSKVFRAISSQIEEQKDDEDPWDSSVSAWIICQSLDRMIFSLSFCLKNPKFKLLQQQTKKLIRILEDFRIIIEEKFLKNDYCEQKM